MQMRHFSLAEAQLALPYEPGSYSQALGMMALEVIQAAPPTYEDPATRAAHALMYVSGAVAMSSHRTIMKYSGEKSTVTDPDCQLTAIDIQLMRAYRFIQDHAKRGQCN